MPAARRATSGPRSILARDRGQFVEAMSNTVASKILARASYSINDDPSLASRVTAHLRSHHRRPPAILDRWFPPIPRWQPV